MNLLIFLSMDLPTAIQQYFSAFLHHRCFFRLKQCSKFWHGLPLKPTLGQINITALDEKKIDQLMKWKPKSISSTRGIHASPNMDSVIEIKASSIKDAHYLINLQYVREIECQVDLRSNHKLIGINISNILIPRSQILLLPKSIVEITSRRVPYIDGPLEFPDIKKLTVAYLTPDIAKLTKLEFLEYNTVNLENDVIPLPPSLHTLISHNVRSLQQLDLSHVRHLEFREDIPLEEKINNCIQLPSTLHTLKINDLHIDHFDLTHIQHLDLYMSGLYIHEYYDTISHIKDISLHVTGHLCYDFPEHLLPHIITLKASISYMSQVIQMCNIEKLHILNEDEEEEAEDYCEFHIWCEKSQFKHWPKISELHVRDQQIYGMIDTLRDTRGIPNNNPRSSYYANRPGIRNMDYIIWSNQHKGIGMAYMYTRDRPKIFELVMP